MLQFRNNQLTDAGVTSLDIPRDLNVGSILPNTVQPRSIRLEASSFCQLRCPSCPTTSRAIYPVVGSGFLRLEDFRKLVDHNPWVDAIELSNFGEIFLNPQLVSILEYAYRRGVKVSAGNGVNLNTARLRTLEAVVKFEVQFLSCSIDGASPETYCVYRVRGDFDAVIANIRTINAHKRAYGTELPRLRWQFVVFGHNEHELPLARQMADELGMKFCPKLTWDNSFSPLRNPEFVRKQGRDRCYHAAGIRGGGTANSTWPNCAMGSGILPQVNWDGKMLGCCVNYWGDFGGNVFRDGLLATINGDKMRYARDMLLGHRSRPRRYPLRDLRELSKHKSARFLAAARRSIEHRPAQGPPPPASLAHHPPTKARLNNKEQKAWGIMGPSAPKDRRARP